LQFKTRVTGSQSTNERRADVWGSDEGERGFGRLFVSNKSEHPLQRTFLKKIKKKQPDGANDDCKREGKL
jgi:hypothetical protein